VDRSGGVRLEQPVPVDALLPLVVEPWLGIVKRLLVEGAALTKREVLLVEVLV
jgi:hypothetical protein